MPVHNSQIRNFLLIHKSQIRHFHKYCTTLSQNSPKSRLFKPVFYIVQTCIFVCRKSMYLRTWRSLKPANQKKIGSANSKSAKCHSCGRFANLTDYFSMQICGFAVCRTYLRTGHLCPTNYGGVMTHGSDS
jgi:hypothetical protein